MHWYKDTIVINTLGKGLYPITDLIQLKIREWSIAEGMCYLFNQHTSASLIINESYNPSARVDMESFMEKIVPEGQTWHQHRLEGKDDSPAHIKAMLTQPCLCIPIDNNKLNLGPWQGIYFFEHRRHLQQRSVLLRCLSID